VDLLLASQGFVFGVWVALLILVAFVAWFVARRPYAEEVRHLRDDIHKLLTVPPNEGQRLPVNGRAGTFVDIAASVNRLLDRVDEQSSVAVEQKNAFDDLATTVPEIVLIHTSEILFANRAAAELFGLSPEALVGKPVTDIIRPAYRALMRKQIETHIGNNETLEPIEVQLISAEEQGQWAELHSTATEYNGVSAFVTVAKDITHRKSMEASLGRSKLQARVTLESIGEGIVTTDTQGIIDYMNEAAEQLIGTVRSAGIAKRLGDLIALIDESDRETLGDPVAQSLAERRRVSLGRRALMLSKQSDREFSVELTASPIRAPNGEVAGCVAIFHDVTEVRGLAREMSYQASHDALTGLVNRSEFERRLEKSLETVRAEGAGFVVSYLDLDRFKIVNDTCGHIAGDNLLREVAALLKEQVRDSDTVARVGGDEFAMLLGGCPLDKARQIADNICQAVADHHFPWQDQVFEIGISIGLVEAGPESASAEAILSAADSACYVAKQQGRGRHHVYSARDEILARERGEIQWLQRLQRALKEDEFELYVQPIVATQGSVSRGPAAEVLIRLRDESGKSILPAQFLGAAERYQLMSHIDRWVVRQTLTRIASGVPHLPAQRSCSINLAGQTLGDDGFLEFVVDLLDHTGVDPTKLCFEVSETAVFANLDHARRFISVLHGIGCSFALDNFGSGIGSFASLKNLSLDYLKIDGTYTQSLDQDSINREMIAAMIKLSRQLDFQVVAEQVEDSDSFEAVRQLGVHFIQGYAVERPKPIVAVIH
jgi:diguanylate cyclase (GGDEF)-like protein/PAS domain S-box-containing protein